MSASRARSIAISILSLVAMGVPGCGDLLQEPDTGKLPARLAEVSGNGQTAAAGATLAQPVRVRVVDPAGLPSPGLWVEWSVVVGAGKVSPRNSFSDEDGVAETTWTLGPAPGLQTIRAFVRKGQPMTFDATATAVVP
ncbi:MAG TPA: hypothetical protein VIE68_07720 [Gemmatimonadota bacterium]